MSRADPPEATVDKWIRVLHRPERPRFRWLLLPHGGAGAATFGSWLRPLLGDHSFTSIAAETELIAVQYPGREDRRDETAPADLQGLVRALHRALRRWWIGEATAGSPAGGPPTIIFGHSMGALIGYELLLLAEHQPWWRPTAFVASGHEAPQHLRPGTLHRCGDATLLAEIRRVSGVDLRDLGDERLVSELIAVLREDYRLVETHPRPTGRPLVTPVAAWAGRHDGDLDDAELAAWQQVSRIFYGIRRFPGGHLYAPTAVPEVVRALAGVAAAAGH